MITTDCRLMEEKLKTKEELIVEYEDKIIELEQQLENVNDCLSEKVKLAEIFEDTIESKNKIINDLQDDILNIREKQNVQKNFMRSEKETMTCEKLSLDHNKSQNSLSDISCQTENPNLIDSESNTDNIEIKTRLRLSTNEKNLQTSFLDNNDDEQNVEFVNLKKMFAALEIETMAKKTVNYCLLLLITYIYVNIEKIFIV